MFCPQKAPALDVVTGSSLTRRWAGFSVLNKVVCPSLSVSVPPSLSIQLLLPSLARFRVFDTFESTISRLSLRYSGIEGKYHPKPSVRNCIWEAGSMDG